MLWCRVPNVWMLIMLIFLVHFWLLVVESVLSNAGVVLALVVTELFLEFLVGLQKVETRQVVNRMRK